MKELARSGECLNIMLSMSELDPIEQRRRQREAAKRRTLTLGILAGGIVVAGLLVVVAVLVVKKGGGVAEVAGITAPSEGSEGETWTHTELVEYLVKKGVRMEAKPSIAFGLSGEPASSFVDPGTDREVRVLLSATPRAAKERAGSLGPTAFTWGRFVFFGARNPELAAKIKTVLGK